jgi:hypothetical protein
MMRDGLLALGLLLSAATQFRIAGLPVGPGEVLIALWCVLELSGEMVRGGPHLTPALRRLVVFWGIFALAESLGTLTAVVIGDEHDRGLFLHDAMAYPFLAVTSCGCVIALRNAGRRHRIVWLLAGLGLVCLSLQLGETWDLFGIPGIEPWFGDRLQGWSGNPNQLALACALLTVIGVHLADTADHAGARIAALACALPAIIAGRLTKTDTFTFDMIAAAAIYLVAKMWLWRQVPGSGGRGRAAFAGVVLGALPLLVASALPVLMWDSAGAEQMAMGMAKDGGKQAQDEADLRLELWGQAVDRGMASGMLGLGPGPHLPIPTSIVTARVGAFDTDPNDHPPLDGLPDFEAHNTILDLFTQGGLIAVGSFLWIAFAAFRGAISARSAGLVTVLSAMLLFGMTNLIVRQPLFWFAVALPLAMGDARASRMEG